MNKLLALCYFVLSLYGCDVGGSTFVDRSDTLYSKVMAQSGIARFECLRSASGQCHYSVFPGECAAAHAAAPGAVDGSSSGSNDRRADRCPSDPVERFALTNGSSRLVPGLQHFHICVSSDDGAPGPDCEAAVASRSW